MSGSITLPHRCPRCGETAKTYQEMEQKFGFRNIDDKKATNQSWCRDCRKFSY